MIENTDAEQIERLNARVVELLREKAHAISALEDVRASVWRRGEVPYAIKKLDEVIAKLKGGTNE